MSKQIEKAFQKAVSEGVFPAAEVLVSSKGETLFHERFGQARQGSCFDIASLTKPLCTGALTLMLIKEGLLKPEDNLFRWLAGARQPFHKLITVENLLDHKSGLPSWRGYFNELPLDLIGTDAGKSFILESCFSETLNYEPGSKTVYGDIAYILLGEILEQAGNASLDVLFANRITHPLNLKNTFFVRKLGKQIGSSSNRGFAKENQHVPVSGKRDKREKKINRRFLPTEDCPWRERVVHGEVDDQNAYALGGVAGHAGLFSQASDIHKFISEYAKCYAGKSDWIPEKTIKEFINFEKYKSKKTALYLGGWNTPSPSNSMAGNYFSRYSIGHLGYTGCSMWVDLKNNFWIILLTNRIHPSTTNQKIKSFRPQIHDQIYKQLIK